MPKKAKERTATEVKRLTGTGLHAVGGVAGLHLQVKGPARSWILRVKVGSKRRDMGLGGYPDVTLARAREKAREQRDKIEQGIDPIVERRSAKSALIATQAKAITFAEAAKRCHASRQQEFRNAKHRKDWLSSIERHANPTIGQVLVVDIDVSHVLDVLQPIWAERTETATRLRQRIEAVLAWATVSKFRVGDNPAQWKGCLDAVLPKPSKIKKITHHRAIPWQEVGAFMVELRKREGMAARALEFIILTAARSGEVRLATWDEIDLQARLWAIPAERMKAEKEHKVPLSDEAVRLLNSIPRMGEHVFTAPRGGSLSDMSISAVCRRMKIEAVPHGFRSSFKDWARNRSAYPDEVSELALAHVNSDATRAAYARDELLPQRTRLMEDWATYCATVQKAGEVTPIRGALL